MVKGNSREISVMLGLKISELAGLTGVEVRVILSNAGSSAVLNFILPCFWQKSRDIRISYNNS